MNENSASWIPVRRPMVRSVTTQTPSRFTALADSLVCATLVATKGFSVKVSRIRFSTAILLMLVCALAATAQKPRLVLPQTPEFAGLCIDANLYIVRQAQEVIAYDMDSGEARWRYEDWPVEIYPNSIQGKHNLILGGTSNGRVKIVVLKMENGELLWERTERPRDPFRGMEAMQDSDWFLVRYARGTSKSGQDEERYPLLFSPEGKGPYRLPQAMWPTEWQEEGRTLLLAVRGRTPVRLMLWDLETGAKQDHCVNLDGYYIGRLHDGGLLVSRYFRDREPHLTVNVVDCDKGHLMREVAVPGPIEGTWLIRDGRAILMIGESGSRLWMVDADTNEVLTALHQPGHEFVLPSVNEDASGRVWIISRDTEGFGYLWAVEAGAAFRKVFDPGPFISGSLREVDPPHVITVTYRTDASRTLRVINFEKRCVVADYKVSKRTEVYDLMFSRSMQRCAVQCRERASPAAQRLPGRFSRRARGTTTLPDARMLTLSPDGSTWWLGPGRVRGADSYHLGRKSSCVSPG